MWRRRWGSLPKGDSVNAATSIEELNDFLGNLEMISVFCEFFLVRGDSTLRTIHNLFLLLQVYLIFLRGVLVCSTHIC